LLPNQAAATDKLLVPATKGSTLTFSLTTQQMEKLISDMLPQPKPRKKQRLKTIAEIEAMFDHA